jgi:disulfide bond formation protein DsbB
MAPKEVRNRNGAWALLFSCWLLATVSTLGSLFFSEVMQFAPCSLCWYQRIFMFPLAVVLLVGLFPPDAKCVKYALPLALGGWVVALYHALLHMGIIPESAAPCQQGVSCSEEYIDLLGFLSIPLLSLISFSGIAALLVVLKRRFSR